MIPALLWPRAALTVARTFGWRGASLRAVHDVRRAIGAFRGAPRHRTGAGGRPLFAVNGDTLRSVVDRAEALARADQVTAGEYLAFGWAWRPLPTTAEDWRHHPETGGCFPLDPWWRVPHLDPVLGDIKQVWEPARFTWVYDLVRGWIVSGEIRYVEAFHRVFASWADASPPFRGPHWACGQETGIRAIALLHAEGNLPAAGGERERLTAVLGWSGERIADAIGYAISQRNNHSLSEAAALVALGIRLDGCHPEARRWLRLGRHVLGREILDQFEPDGWYIQHSFNYLRLALDQCAIAASALGTLGEGLSDRARHRLAAGIALLAAVIDPDGDVPNHGANDGALVVPRSLAPFRDHRPTLTLAAAALGVPLPADVNPDREAAAWAGQSLPALGPGRADGVVTGAGWAVARVGGTRVFFRAGRYRSRPSHLDPLQLDVRFAEGPVIVDPGTFLYNGVPPWRNGLVSALVHNGPVLNDREPGIRGPRFLWYTWPSARITAATWDGTAARLVGVAEGEIQREVEIRAGEVVVRDRVPGGGTVRVRWLLHPAASPEQVEVEAGATVRLADEGATAGWYSPHYTQRVRTHYIDIVRTATPMADIRTRIRPRSPGQGSPAPR